jgi:glycosyltransferase involved in cell wall biosynthesis
MDLSIIIPTLNRAHLLEKTLLSISRNKVDFKLFEVLVIDNGSTDNTKLIVENFSQDFPYINLFYHFEPEPGLLAGRHRGLFESKCEFLTYLDDDVELNNQFINKAISNFNQYPEYGLFTGPCFPLYDSYPPSWIFDFWQNCSDGKYLSYLSLLDFGEKVKEIDPLFVWGLNFSIRKKIVYDLGGFHPDNMPFDLQFYQGSGETAITYSAKKEGIKAMYDPLLLLHHFVPNERMTLNYFDRRAYYQGISESFFINRTNFSKSFGLFQYFTKVISMFKNLLLNRRYYYLYKRFENKKIESEQRHSRKFKTEEKYRMWVLKKDYFDYKISKYL